MDSVIGLLPNKTTRKLLAVEWKNLNEEKRAVLKAARARRGVKCDICGSVGYYRENCPNGCQSPPSTPDSLASTPPVSARKEEAKNIPSVGLFWGTEAQSTEREKMSFYQAKKKVDMNTVRPQAQETMTALQASDDKLGSFAFFTHADNSYARDYAELTLHQVMRRIVRLLENQLQSNVANLTASFDTTLLHPPNDKIGDTFYPEELGKDREYKDYFIKKETKVGHKLKYKNQASLRPVDDLDCIFRGGNMGDDHLYRAKPNAGESMHAKNTWKSVLSKSDTLANSDPALVRKQQQLEKLFRDQSQWISAQSKSMTFRNDRFEHLVHILQSEIKREHARDGKVLSATSNKARRDALMEVWTERLTSVDRLIDIMRSYRFAAGTEEADFLLFCLGKWKEISRLELSAVAGEGKVKEKAKAKARGGRDLVASSTNPYFPDVEFLEKYIKKNQRLYEKSKEGFAFTAEKQRELTAAKEREKDERLQRMGSTQNLRPKSRDPGSKKGLPSLDDIVASAQSEAKDFAEEDAKREAMIKRYKLGGDPGEAVAETRKPRIKPREADAINMAKMKRSFRLAGLGTRIRMGNDTDLAQALPALIPIPRAFDGDSKIDSYAAQNIVFDLKRQMVLSDIGYTPQRVVPLYVRSTLEEKEGTSMHGDPSKEELAQDRRYSHYLGRPLVRFNSSVTLPAHLASATASTLLGSIAASEQDDQNSEQLSSQPDEFALTALSFSRQDKEKLEQKLDKKTRKELKKAQEEVRHLPITNSLVRMVFNNPEPSLGDLKYLDEAC